MFWPFKRNQTKPPAVEAEGILKSAIAYLESSGIGRNMEYNCARNILIYALGTVRFSS